MKKFALLAVSVLVCCALVFCACAQEPVQPETFKVLVDKLHFDVPMPGVLESGDKLFLPLGSVNGVRVDNWVIKIVDDTIKLYPSFESEAIVSAACSRRRRQRFMSACQRRNFIPKVVGSAWTPCVRPITGVCW